MDFGRIVGKWYDVGRRKFYLGGNIGFLGQSLQNSPFSDEVFVSTMEPGEEIGGQMSWSIIFPTGMKVTTLFQKQTFT